MLATLNGHANRIWPTWQLASVLCFESFARFQRNILDWVEKSQKVVEPRNDFQIVVRLFNVVKYSFIQQSSIVRRT